MKYERHIHIGDTPMDVKAAVMGEAEPVGVDTGIYSREELLEASKGRLRHLSLQCTGMRSKVARLRGCSLFAAEMLFNS